MSLTVVEQGRTYALPSQRLIVPLHILPNKSGWVCAYKKGLDILHYGKGGSNRVTLRMQWLLKYATNADDGRTG